MPSKLNPDTEFFRCERYNTLCNARVWICHDKIIKASGRHTYCHAQGVERINVIKVENAITQRASTSNDAPHRIVAEEISAAALSEASASKLPNIRS